MTIKPTTYEVLEYAAELGERFPDLSNYAVLTSVEDFCDKQPEPDTPLGHTILVAYNTHSADIAANEMRRVYGIEVAHG